MIKGRACVILIGVVLAACATAGTDDNGAPATPADDGSDAAADTGAGGTGGSGGQPQGDGSSGDDSSSAMETGSGDDGSPDVIMRGGDDSGGPPDTGAPDMGTTMSGACDTSTQANQFKYDFEYGQAITGKNPPTPCPTGACADPSQCCYMIICLAK